MRHFITVGLAVLSVLGANAAATIVTYEYTGNEWSFTDFTLPDGTRTGYGFADQQFITATLSIDARLLPDNSLKNVTIEGETKLGEPLPPESPLVSITMFDGVLLSSLTKQSGPRAFSVFRFSTDDEGFPSSWSIAFDEDPPTMSISGTPESGRDSVFFVGAGHLVALSDTPGTWVRTVPEPGIGALFGLGLLSFAFQRARAQRRQDA